jgi:gag-polypeptide of LTR copia-type
MLVTDNEANRIVEGCPKDAIKAYKALKDKYQSASNERKLALRDALSSIRLKTGTDPDDAILELESLRRKTEQTGGTVDDEMMMTVLLKALGEEYNTVKTMIVTSSSDFEAAKSIVRTHYRLHPQQSQVSTINNESSTALLAGKTFACDICKKDTHTTSECYYNKRRIATNKSNNSSHNGNSNSDEHASHGKTNYKP